MVNGYIDEKPGTDSKADNLLISITGTDEESVVRAPEEDVEDLSNRIVENLIFE